MRLTLTALCFMVFGIPAPSSKCPPVHILPHSNCSLSQSSPLQQNGSAHSEYFFEC